MKALIYALESLSIWIGRAFGWCILILTFSVSYEVFVRYVLNAPTVWVFDMMVQMYGALFLMAGPYALAQDSHVRGDVLYRLMPVRWQARIDFTLYLLFFFPGMLALFWYGWEIAADSWRYQEVSWNSPARIQIYFFKTLIPRRRRTAHFAGHRRDPALLARDAQRRLARSPGGRTRTEEALAEDTAASRG